MTTENLAPQPAPAIKPTLDPRAVLKRLQELSPTFREYKPLALHIDTAILERFPEFERKALRSALRFHTTTTRYLKSIERSTERFDLDGQVTGEVTEEQRSHAAGLLKERFATVARNQREKRQAEEAERRHAEKLSQLVNKFTK